MSNRKRNRSARRAATLGSRASRRRPSVSSDGRIVKINPRIMRQSPAIEALISDAALAAEIFGDDELEGFSRDQQIEAIRAAAEEAEAAGRVGSVTFEDLNNLERQDFMRTMPPSRKSRARKA